MNKDYVSVKSLRLAGTATSLYMALAYLAGIIIFIAVLKYPQITDEMEKVKIIVDMKPMVFATNLIMYVFFGPVLVLFILNLSSRLENSATLLARFSAVTGFIWAGSLTASGMISNAAIGPVTRLFSTDPGQAVRLSQTLDAVSTGLGNGNGEILGGLMTLGFGIAMLKGSRFHRGTGVLGVIVGAVGIISIVPALTGLTAVFGILQLAWFIWTGFSKA